MGRGVSSGGGQSSLGYLFGSGEAPKPTATTNGTSPAAGSEVPRMQNEVAKEIPQKSTTASPSSPPGVAKEIPAGIPGNTTITNNYFRADGQNCGNFLTAEFFRFYEVCKSLDVGHGERFIKIEQSPASFLQAMEEYVREAPRVSIVRKDQEGYIKLWKEAIQVLGEVNTYMQP